MDGAYFSKILACAGRDLLKAITKIKESHYSPLSFKFHSKAQFFIKGREAKFLA
jgi:hypothetical protein